ncbi:aminotransferase class I/II-fold pyridoxal phosphate-dependent enzyme [Paenisporosarcina cavernae]|uniref:Methionine gamma-lyase family protein n=1 Tax=Paenisporosarcina cavernae TaxID=2320858 RepID=A0A385YV11_9BACL|nr:methionine gamma-lyase family protein [Paenisporosarcina cavernae]AYC29323.1 hypothetical protein D3873_05290 [Paenisporosarcina cavernae]
MFVSAIESTLLLEASKIEEKLRDSFSKIEEVAFYNQEKVLHAFHDEKISDQHLQGSTGYGYDDHGRDALERVYAKTFGAEAGLVRPQIVSGTHAITLSLFGVLRPGDNLLYITGKPYDTLHSIVGAKEKDTGSLSNFHIGYQHIDLLDSGEIDWKRVEAAIHSSTKVIAIQRSKGYANRPSFSVEAIGEMVKKIRSIKKDVIIFVDNCYGEFVEKLEPTNVGVDLMAGSLIKNPGGGIAKTGGYIVGRKDLVELCAFRLTSPGLGAEVGASLNALQDMYQGFFLAPHIVSQAVKGATFTSEILQQYGFTTSPSSKENRTDLIQSVTFHSAQEMISFCQVIQQQSPINAHFLPEAAYMPGYEDDVVMAAGTFVQGSSLELTADGPVRPPYTAYIQGGLTYEHVKLAILMGITTISKKK